MSDSVRKCPYCEERHVTVRERMIIVDLNPDSLSPIVSCWGCSQKIIAKTYSRYGVQQCEFCNQYRPDVELREVYVDTDQNREEHLCCSPCENDRLMSV